MSEYQHYSDEELIEELIEVDSDPDVDVTAWEADFIEDMIRIYYSRDHLNLTDNQRSKLIQIVEEYNGTG